MSKKLGRLERVNLDEAWQTEAGHFTPWLAQEENLELLGEVLGIDLEREAVEKNVGPFRADILCKDTAENSWVLIENQIAKTDHTHLGQLMTYAAGLNDAEGLKVTTIVWISSNFRDEHRAALDWLNEMTVDSVRFFGLEVELWKIGDSLAAPRFNIICQPNDWKSTVRDAAEAVSSDDDRPSHILRMKYWTAFRSYLQENKSKLRPQKPSKDHWYSFGIGTSQAHTNALLIARDNIIAVELTLKMNSKEVFADLYSRKAEIESEIGAELDWRELPDKKTSRILLLKNANGTDEKDWPKQFEWLQETLEKFDDIFRPYFQQRKISA
jgi:hypothetical protein